MNIHNSFSIRVDELQWCKTGISSVVTYLCKWELTTNGSEDSSLQYSRVLKSPKYRYNKNIKKIMHGKVSTTDKMHYSLPFGFKCFNLHNVHFKIESKLTLLLLFNFLFFFTRFTSHLWVYFKIYIQLGHLAVGTPTRNTSGWLTLCHLPPLPQRVQWWEHWSVLRSGRLCSALHLWSSWPGDRTDRNNINISYNHQNRSIFFTFFVWN